MKEEVKLCLIRTKWQLSNTSVTELVTLMSADVRVDGCGSTSTAAREWNLG